MAQCRTIPELLFFRILQCGGASPGFAIGAGVIGDIYKLEERGTAMGIFLAVRFLFSYGSVERRIFTIISTPLIGCFVRVLSCTCSGRLNHILL